VNEYSHEPIPGLPGELPEGEQVLWQASPTWDAMAKRVFQVYTAALYFLALIAGHLIYRIMDGAPLSMLTGTLAWQGGLALTVVGILALMAKLYASSTLYTITSRRLIIRSGLAMPMIVNLPLTKVESAGLRDFEMALAILAFCLLRERKCFG
jgi:hypothetical protein